MNFPRIVETFGKCKCFGVMLEIYLLEGYWDDMGKSIHVAFYYN